MSSPYQKYRTSAAHGWTRIDMLIAVYDAAIRAMDRGLAAAGPDATSQVSISDLCEAQRCVLMLIDGLDDSVGEPVTLIRRLLVFVIDRLQTRAAADWTTARKMIDTLRDAFRQIADEGRRLEQSGEIAPLAAAAHMHTASA